MIETMAVRTGENVQRGARHCNRNTSCYAAALSISSAESKGGRLGRRASLFLFLACRVEHGSQVGHEAFIFMFARFLIRLTQQR